MAGGSTGGGPGPLRQGAARVRWLHALDVKSTRHWRCRPCGNHTEGRGRPVKRWIVWDRSRWRCLPRTGRQARSVQWAESGPQPGTRPHARTGRGRERPRWRKPKRTASLERTWSGCRTQTHAQGGQPREPSRGGSADNEEHLHLVGGAPSHGPGHRRDGYACGRRPDTGGAGGRRVTGGSGVSGATPKCPYIGGSAVACLGGRVERARRVSDCATSRRRDETIAV